MVQRNSIVVVAVLGCIAIVSGLFFTGIGPFSAGSTPSADAPSDNKVGLVMSSTGAACLNQSVRPHGGWIHVVADGEAYDVTVNATVHHERSEAVDVNLTDKDGGIYEIRFTTDETVADDTETRVATESADCEVGTRIDAAGSVPTDFETLRVTVDDEVVQTIDREGTFPILRQLPNPVGQ